MNTKTKSFRKRRNSKGERTRLEIVKAAGQLFADRGFDGVSIRDISDSLRLMPSLVMHHFESKENLYHKVVEHFILSNTGLHRTILPLLPQQFASREAMTEALAEFVRLVFETWHGPKRIKCLNSLLLQLVSGKSPVSPLVVEGWTKVFEDAIEQFLLQARGGWTETELRIRLEIIWGNLFYPGLIRNQILYIQGLKEYAPDFLLTWERQIVRDLALALDLPEPSFAGKAEGAISEAASAREQCVAELV